MKRSQTMLLLVAVVAVAVVAFVVLKPSDDESTSRTGSQGSTSKTASSGQTAAPAPKVARIRVRGAKPVGGVAKITARSGDTVRIAVTSDVADEVHLHGYDIARDAGPGKVAHFSFPAKLEGAFEIELEKRGVKIAQLEVQP